MLSAVISSERSYPAVLLAEQLVHQPARSPRSSRTRGNSPQPSYAHGR